MGFLDWLFKGKGNQSKTPINQVSIVRTTEKESTTLRDTHRLLYTKLRDYTVIDLETSSKYANKASIIELAAVRVRGGRIVKEYSTLIRPLEPITAAVTGITGITNEMLGTAPTIDLKLREFLQFLGNDVLLGHNIHSFDMNVLNYACKSLNIPPLKNDVLDTLLYAKKCDIAVFNYRLPTLARHFSIKYDAHRALNDCIANYYVYEALKGKYSGVSHEPLDRSKQSKENMRKCAISPEYADINGKTVVLTGEFEIGTREDVQAKLEGLGAVIKRDVSGNTDYLIIGSLGDSRWHFGSYGRKIEKAIALQEEGKQLIMVEEEHFFILQK